VAPPHREGRVEAQVFAKRLTGSPEPWLRVAEFSAEPDEVATMTRDVVDEVAAQHVGSVVRVVRRKQVFDWYVPDAGPRVRIPLAREFWLGSSVPSRVIGGADWITAWYESTHAPGMMHALAKLNRRTLVRVLCDVSLSITSILRSRGRAERDVSAIEAAILAIMEVLGDPDAETAFVVAVPAPRERDARNLADGVVRPLQAATMSLGATWQEWSNGSFFPESLTTALQSAAGPSFDLPAAMRARLPMPRLVALLAPVMRRAREP